MSKVKATVCTVLLSVVIFVLLFMTTRVSKNSVNLFNCMTSCVAGVWTADKLICFYKWLRKNKHQD